MQSFMDFLAQGNRTQKDLRPQFLRWVKTFTRFTQGETIDSVSMDRFLRWLDGKYPSQSIQQARKALQLYSYYRTRCGATAVARPSPAASSLPPRLPSLPRPLFLSWQTAEEAIIRIMRMKHLSQKTEKAYLAWIRQFKDYLDAKSCSALTEQDLKGFLSFLAVERNVAAATQRLAFNAILFLYRNVLRVEINGLSTVVPSRVPKKLPVVLSREEILRVFSRLKDTNLLIARLIYGAGLRLEECLSLRVKDIDFDRDCLTIRGGKGNKDRETVLPEKATSEIHRHLMKVHALFLRDAKDCVAGVMIPGALGKKYPNAGHEWGWYWVFPSDNLCIDPASRVVRRYHIHPTTFQRAFREAVRAAGIVKRASVHTLRHYAEF